MNHMPSFNVFNVQNVILLDGRRSGLMLAPYCMHNGSRHVYITPLSAAIVLGLTIKLVPDITPHNSL